MWECARWNLIGTVWPRQKTSILHLHKTKLLTNQLNKETHLLCNLNGLYVCPWWCKWLTGGLTGGVTGGLTGGLTGGHGRLSKQTTNLGNAWVGALDVPGREVQPAACIRGDGRTMLLHGASALTAAPAALELPLRPQTHATAVPLGTALVEMHCGVTQRTSGQSLWFKVISENRNGFWCCQKMNRSY